MDQLGYLDNRLVLVCPVLILFNVFNVSFSWKGWNQKVYLWGWQFILRWGASSSASTTAILLHNWIDFYRLFNSIYRT